MRDDAKRGSFANPPASRSSPAANCSSAKSSPPAASPTARYFQYEETDWECDLIYDGHLTARERYCLRPDNASITPLQSPFPAAFFASCYLITDRCPADHDRWKKIRAHNSEKVRLGVTPLIRAGWSIKILTQDSLSMAKTCEKLRAKLSGPFPALMDSSRFQ